MRIIIALMSLVITVSSCGSKGNANAEKSDTTKFFQTAFVIQKDIREVNATPYYLYRLDEVNGKKDSTPINTAQFNKIAARFLNPDINDKKLKPFYKESIFEDQTMQGFTVNYSTTNKDLEIHSVDVLLKDDGKTIKNIMIRKFFNYKDSSAIEQLTWKPGEKFQILRSVQKPDNSENNYQTTVVWNQKS